jgi:NAD(P)-dependent dehydrogenase (short-subunit alcohol dehydrogenase family)
MNLKQRFGKPETIANALVWLCSAPEGLPLNWG